MRLERDGDRARLAAMFGTMTEPGAPLGAELCATLRTIATLDDADLERLRRWFSKWMSRYGQVPRATGSLIDPKARRDTPEA